MMITTLLGKGYGHPYLWAMATSTANMTAGLPTYRSRGIDKYSSTLATQIKINVLKADPNSKPYH
jgi:hypothetical protein